jgi:hypothetical protein
VDETIKIFDGVKNCRPGKYKEIFEITGIPDIFSGSFADVKTLKKS